MDPPSAPNPPADPSRRNRAAALLSIVSNTCLVIVKLVVGLVTGSVAVISEAAHSSSDLLASGIAYLGVRASARPADDDHRYGHHKAENLAAGLEGVLVLAVGGVVAVESLRRLVEGGEPVVHLEWAVAVMVLSAVVNTAVARHLYRVARGTGSPAIEGDAAHLSADVWTSAGTAAGLMVVAATGWDALDAAIALAVAGYVVWLGLRLTGRAAQALLDHTPPEADLAAIERTLGELAGDGVSFHAVRARRAGSTTHIDLHMVVPPETTVREGHRMSGRVKSALTDAVADADVLIHLEDHGRSR
ncbi:MAG: cation diffusion facilitator family transporter [Miltoncostaeaceae bacterium]